MGQEFKATLSYIARHCFKKKKIKINVTPNLTVSVQPLSLSGGGRDGDTAYCFSGSCRAQETESGEQQACRSHPP